MARAGEYPLITVAMVALNREWIIGHALKSLLSQTYPHDRIFFVLVDGGSVDRTVEVVREALSGSDLAGFEVVVQRSNIPEARNIAIERMRGEAIFFWDSDVLLEPRGLEELVRAMYAESVDVVSASVSFAKFRDVSEGWRELERLCSEPRPSRVELVHAVTMSATLIRREVLERLRFDPDLTFGEDIYFCVKARELGFKVAVHRGVVALDVNPLSDESDVFISKPLGELLRGLRKKAYVKVFNIGADPCLRDVVSYMWKYKRYLYYLGYVPAFAMLATGLATGFLPLVLLPATYVLSYLALEVSKRGVRTGLKVFVQSLLLGLPFSTFMLAYGLLRSLQNTIKKLS